MATAGNRPPLPTACLAGNCGASAQTFVQYGGASMSTAGTALTVKQSTSKAILNWADFNIASGYSVNFLQPSATSAVLNNIWSSDPSVIAGRLHANGQVYLYDQNGIVFSKGAQVDVGGLVASTLALPNTLFENGILSRASADVPVFSAATPEVTPGAVSVDAGATLTAADGQRILLLGSAVTNQGKITAPDGQVILGAATQGVYLAASSDPSLRGLLIEVNGGGLAGTVVNAGDISAPRGNITLAGLLVKQQGVLSATTSVSENGSIYLVAGDTSQPNALFYNPAPVQANGQPTAFGGLLPNNGGTLILAPGSVTEVLPDTSDTSTLNLSEQASFIPSQVDLVGRSIALSGNATIHAPGGRVNFYAASNPYLLNSAPAQSIDGDNGSIYLDSASVIDVSGLANVSVPVTQNLLQITLETDDLQNDPLQRNGFLHGAKVTVDLSSPPALFDITPYVDNIELNISQVLTKGGAIELNATGDVITRAGSMLNVSGGSVAYQSGYGPATTDLLGADGKVYNISTAPNSIQYVGFANNYAHTDPTWGVSTQGSEQVFYAGYIQGQNAGSLTVESPLVYLRGSMLANTVNGINQRSLTSLAQGGTFELGCGGCLDAARLPDYGLNGGVGFSNDLQDTLIGNIVADGSVISSTNIPTGNLVSPSQLTQSGFNQISVFSNGSIALPAGDTLALAAGGALTLKSARSIDIGGDITGADASVLLQTVTANDLHSHDISIDPGAAIDTSGVWINDSPSVTSQPGTTPTAINGGSVTVNAAGNLMLGAGTVIDVSGGGWINQSGQLAKGSAGSLTLAASFSLSPSNSSIDPYIGTLTLSPSATLLGASLSASGGGKLSLESGSVTVGVTAADTPGELLLSPNFFSQGGFANYQITGSNDLVVGNVKDPTGTAPISIAPLVKTLTFESNPQLQPTGSHLGSFTQLTTLPAALRSAANLTLAANASDNSGAEVGDVTLAKDAAIATDPGGSVNLEAQGYNGDVRVYGDISASAGTISLQVAGQAGANGDPGFIPDQQILLGSGASLSAQAYPKLNTLNSLGYSEGSILGAGTVSLVANKGFIVTDPGSLIDVSGTVGTIDVVGTGGVVPTTVAGGAGTINLEAREGMVLQGALMGKAASLGGTPVAGARAGTLNIDLGYGFDYGQLSSSAASYPTAPRVLTLVGTTTDGQPAEPPTNQLLSGTSFINVSTLESGGFDNLSVQSSDTIGFAGAVSLHANASLVLDAPLFQGDHAQTALSAPYVAVGNYFNIDDYFGPSNASLNAGAVVSPTAGDGTLAVSAQLIDIRGISGWSGFAVEDFKSSGDIRLVAPANYVNAPPSLNVAGNSNFEGAFNTSAALTLTAAQVYPTTATQFAINDLTPSNPGASPVTPTSVTISSSTSAGVPAVPLSAGGSLSINANEINQEGVLRAPVGELALNAISIPGASGGASAGDVTLASGSLTSVSADGMTIPYGATQNGLEWTYSPTSGVTNVLSAPPAKQITMNGASVNLAAGAKIDLSGGGDLYAYEFIAGQGGSVDVLNPSSLPAANHPAGTTAYTYAILPSLGSLYAPFDPQYAQGQTTTGQTITLSGVPGLAAGTYALLPARYALLPGAFAVQILQADSGLAAGAAVQQSNGSFVVAGKFGIAGTSVLDSLTSTVEVASSATVRTESQYTDAYANAFFFTNAASTGTVAPSLPADAGQLVLSATNALSLRASLDLGTGSFVSGTNASGKSIVQDGRGGDVAIVAPSLLVTDSPDAQAAPGTVQLLTQQLDDLGAQTLILGGSISDSAAGEQIVLSAQTVELKNLAALTAPEIILAAKDNVLVDSGAQLSAANSAGGAGSPAPGTLLIPGSGALLRISSGAADTLTVEPTTSSQSSTGIVTIDSQARITAGGSLLLYGASSATTAPGAQIDAPAVSLYSSLVGLGDAPSNTSGLVLTSQLLNTFKGLTDLTIGSASTINFYGSVDLGTPGSSAPKLANISLDATGIVGYGAGDKVLEAGSVTLMNSSGDVSAISMPPDGTGALKLVATAASGSGQITLGGGDKLVSGFSAVDLQADADILIQGAGGLSLTSSSAVPLNLTAHAIIAGAGANQTLEATGAVSITTSSAKSNLALPSPGAGATLSITGSSIEQTGAIDLPSGSITLTATDGSLTLGDGARIFAGGAAQAFQVTDAVTAGGQVTLNSLAGNVSIQAGAVVDVSGITSGSQSGDAGSLSIAAPSGTFALAGSLTGSAASGHSAGNFTLDVASGLAGTGLTRLDTQLAAGGFKGAIDLRTREDSEVVVASTVDAESFTLAADSGSIEIAGNGVINTSGGTAIDTNGGPIALWAGKGLTLEAGAQLLANAGSPGPEGANGTDLAAHGGDIILGTASGQLLLIGGSARAPTVISMLGDGGADTDGTLTLRAPRTADDSNVQITVSAAPAISVLSRNPIVVEGVRAYTANELGDGDAGCGTGGSCDVTDEAGVLFTDAAAFMSAMATLPSNLAGLQDVQVRPGIEIDSPITAGSNGDLILDGSSGVWDLASWNAGLGAPVNLTLRAAGNLIFDASLSDGFTNNGQVVSSWTFGEPGVSNGSASYRLAAGADLFAANPLAVVPQPAPLSSLEAPPNSGNVIVTPGNLIRTGSGNIDIAAGADVLLGYAYAGYAAGGALQVTEDDPLSSVIYTAGIPSVLTAAQSALFTPTFTGSGRRGSTNTSYPTDGGNISVTAADDVRSAISAQFVSDWLWRRAASPPPFALVSNTSWWVMFNDFDQGIGALAGGEFSLRAGRDIVNTSAVIPTTGRLLLAAGGTPVTSDLLLTGGGMLHVQAGGDILSGIFEDDWGNAVIAAGGALKSSADSTFGQQYPNVSGGSVQPLSPDTEIYPILAVGNGTFNVSGATGVSLGGVTTSTTLPISLANQTAVQDVSASATFYTYAPSGNPGTLNVVSSGGNVTLITNAVANVPVAWLSANGITYATGPTDASTYLATFPSTLNVAALSGNIDIGDPTLALTSPNPVDIALFPGSTGNLRLLSEQSINNNGQPFTIDVSEGDPTTLPTIFAPANVGAFAGVADATLPLAPLHQTDPVPITLVANTGSISPATLIFPKAADVIAAGTLTDLNYIGKNLNASDVTLIQSGGDITYSTPTLPISNDLLPNLNGITVGGPGYAEILAGGSISLGDANGVETSGSLADSRLPSSGASIIVGAGFGSTANGALRQPAYQSFINTYLAPNAKTDTPSTYASNLTAYMRQLNPVANANISYTAALKAFEGLTPTQQLPLLSAVLMDELSATGLAHTLHGTGYQSGYDAINTLFPTTNAQGSALTYSGDVNMFYSQLKTEQGGDIDLLVPGGSVVVGLPNPPANLGTIKGFTTSTGLFVPGAVNLGILALGEGAIEGFADEDFDINQSRILTLEGGDIILWASNGGIDAGKGAKSASGAPPPVIQTDANGNLFVDPSNAVAGSGIGQLLTVPGIKAGLVNLIAPKGVVNAGDAGIRVAGNLNIAAVQVIGAANITVAGTATGVPTSEAGAFAGALSGANSVSDASKNVTDQIANDLGAATNYQQLTESLAPAFISVKMFCLGVECEAN